MSCPGWPRRARDPPIATHPMRCLRDGMAARRIALLFAPVALALIVLGGSSGPDAVAADGALIVAVGAENEYANVISQIGGRTCR